eukprot:gene401-422_t
MQAANRYLRIEAGVGNSVDMLAVLDMLVAGNLVEVDILVEDMLAVGDILVVEDMLAVGDTLVVEDRLVVEDILVAENKLVVEDILVVEDRIVVLDKLAVPELDNLAEPVQDILAVSAEVVFHRE